MKKHYCPNCGAPITSEVCPFCNTTTGIQSEEITPEYPVIECKSAKMTFFRTVFPLIFMVAFGFSGFLVPFLLEKNAPMDNGKISILVFLPFMVISVVAGLISFSSIFRYLITKVKGKDITGIVYGYVDDMITINGVPAQKVKILVNTGAGKRFILYSTGSTSQTYQVNSRINLKVYKKNFLVMENENYF